MKRIRTIFRMLIVGGLFESKQNQNNQCYPIKLFHHDKARKFT